MVVVETSALLFRAALIVAIRRRPAPGAAIGGGTLDGWLVLGVDPAPEQLGAVSPRRPPARPHRRRFDWASMVA